MGWVMRGCDKLVSKWRFAALEPLGLFRRGIGMEFQKEPSGFPCGLETKNRQRKVWLWPSRGSDGFISWASGYAQSRRFTDLKHLGVLSAKWVMSFRQAVQFFFAKLESHADLLRKWWQKEGKAGKGLLYMDPLRETRNRCACDPCLWRRHGGQLALFEIWRMTTIRSGFPINVRHQIEPLSWIKLQRKFGLRKNWKECEVMARSARV